MAKASNSTIAFSDFKTVFCEHFGCSAESFLPELFSRSLDPGWRPLAAVLRRAWPAFFARDLLYLERLGAARNWSDVVSLANGIRSDEDLNRGFLRRALHLRISGARIMKLREEITRARLEKCA